MKYLILFLLVSCGTNKNTMQLSQGYTTQELIDNVEEFEDAFNIDVNFEVVYVDQLSNSNPNSAQCLSDGGSFRRVEIKSTITKPSELSLRIYHELGHCALNISHYDDVVDIMNTYPLINPKQMDTIYIPQMIANYEGEVYE